MNSLKRSTRFHWAKMMIREYHITYPYCLESGIACNDETPKNKKIKYDN